MSDFKGCLSPKAEKEQKLSIGSPLMTSMSALQKGSLENKILQFLVIPAFVALSQRKIFVF